MERNSRSFSSKTLDERFEAFLKESVGSEDDSERVTRFFKAAEEPEEKSPAPADRKPWWASGADTDTSDDPGKGASKFLKSKPSSAATPAAVEPQAKIAIHIPVTESLQTKDSLDASKPSAGDTLSATLDDTAGDSVSVPGGAHDDSDSDDTAEPVAKRYGGGPPARLPQEAGGQMAATSTAAPRETMEDSSSFGEGSLPFVATLDSSSAGLGGGDDTIEEMAEKKRFFEKLEADAGGSVDYARLNSSLDMQATMTSADETPPRPGGPPAAVATPVEGKLQSAGNAAAVAADRDEPDSSDESDASEPTDGPAADRRLPVADRFPASGPGLSSRPPAAAAAPAAVTPIFSVAAAPVAASSKPSLLANVSLRDTMSTLAATTDKLHGNVGGSSGLDNTGRLMLATKPPSFGYTTSQEMDAVREAAEYVLREGETEDRAAGRMQLTEDWSATGSVDGSPPLKAKFHPPAATSSPSAAVTVRRQRPSVALSITGEEPASSSDSPLLGGQGLAAGIPTAVSRSAAESSLPLSPVTRDGGDVWALTAVEDDEDYDDDGGGDHAVPPKSSSAAAGTVRASGSSVPKQKTQRQRKGSAASPSARERRRHGRSLSAGSRAAHGKASTDASPKQHELELSDLHASGSPGSLRRSSTTVRFAHVISSGYGRRLPAGYVAGRERGRSPAASGVPASEDRRTARSRDHSSSPARAAAAAEPTRAMAADKDRGVAVIQARGGTASSSPSRLKQVQADAMADPAASGVASVLAKEKPRDPRLMSSVESFAAYIQTHFARASDKWVPPVERPRHGSGVAAATAESSRTASSAVAAAAAAAAEDALRRELREWIERWEDEKRLNTALSSRMQEIREVLEKRLAEQQAAHDEQMLQVKREAAVAKAKLAAQALDVRMSSGQLAAGNDVPGSTKPPTDGSRQAGSEGEGNPLAALVEEQERLLEGYQRENERLYAELKKSSGERKAVEDGLLRDNHRLASELAMLREQLEAKEAALRTRHVANSPRADTVIVHHDISGGAALGAGRIAELAGELKQTKMLTSKLQADVDRLVRERTDLELRAGQLAAERDRLIEAAAGRERSAAAQATLEAEVERLTKKVRWYAENQELLDRDAQRLREKDATIETLRQQLRHAQSEAGQKQLEARTKGKEKSADAKRILDLERQVKELEGILRKRNPNSLPALMMAAAAASAGSGAEQGAAGAVRFLEDRIRRLEQEIEGKDDECKVALRAAEQRLGNLREKYEERIQGLEQDLAAASEAATRGAGERPYTTASALQRELDAVRESYKKKVADMQRDNDALRSELEATQQKLQSTVKADAAASRQAAAESGEKLKEADAALDRKHVEVMQLFDTIERLQLEKRQLVAELAQLRPTSAPLSAAAATATAAAAPLVLPPDVKRPAATRRAPVAGSTTRVDRSRKPPPGGGRAAADSAFHPFIAHAPSADAAVPSQGDYTPQNFTDQHVDDVLRENERLKAQVDRLELELSQQRVDQQRALAELEAAKRREQEQRLDELSALKRAHQSEIEKIVAAHAAFNSSSRVTELSCKVEAQEVIIKHLKEDRDRWRTDADELAASRIRELALRADVQALKVQLDEAKKFHTPEMRHYDALIRKITEVEARNGQRERDMRLLFAQLSGGSGIRLQDDGGGGRGDSLRWQQALQAKQLQVESFRTELDSILNILRDLKRSGVTLPVAS